MDIRTTLLEIAGQKITLECIPEVNDHGRTAIYELLYHKRLPFPHTFDWKWYSSGSKLTTRMRNAVYKAYGTKIPPDVLTEVGNLARAHLGPDNVTFDITCDLNWTEGQFGDRGSCFWGCYTNHRLALQASGGMAIRFWERRGRGWSGAARAWIHPTDKFAILFNAYSKKHGKYMSNMTMADVLAQHIGGRITSVAFDADIYINSSTPYAVAKYKKDVPREYEVKYGTDYYIWCEHCNTRVIREDAYGDEDDGYFCENCWVDYA